MTGTRSASPITLLDPRAAPVFAGSPTLERLCSGAVWSEGPVWMREDDSVLWSDIPNNRMLRWSERDGMSVWRPAVEYTNGHTRDRNGDLLHCSHGLRAIVRTRCVGGRVDAATADEIVVDRYQGKRFNSPNDLVVKSDGSLWFSDPPYGILSNVEGHQAESELGAHHVFRFDPKSGELEIATSELIDPNGLAFSPDEALLYVSDTSAARLGDAGHHHIKVFEVVAGRTLRNGRVFAVVSPGLSDGFRLDVQGWVYTSSEDGVQLFHPDGTLLARIAVPEKVGNLTFGGSARNVLYICASTSLYRIQLTTNGVQYP